MSKLNKVLLAALVIQLGVVVVTKVFLRGSSRKQPERVFAGLNTEEVTRVTFSDADKKKIEIAKQGDGWVLASGGDYPVKEEKIKELVGKLPGLVSTQVVATSSVHHRALEVTNEKFQRDVTVQAGEKKHQFLLGSSPGIKSVHFRFKDEDKVHLVKELSTWDLTTSATGWVDSKYFNVDKDQIVRMTLTNSAGTLEFEQQGTDWIIKQAPEGMTLDQSAITSYVSSIASISLQEPAGASADPAFGLDKPVATLTVVTASLPKANTKEKPSNEPASGESDADAPAEATTDAKPQLKTVSIQIGGESDGKYYAKSSDSRFYVLVGSWAAEKLTKKKLDDFAKKPADESKKSGSSRQQLSLQAG